MKNFRKILLILLVIVFCSACGKSSNLKSLDYSSFKDKINNGDSFFFVVIKDGCKYCESYVPKLEKILDEYDISGYSLNISDMSQSEYEEFEENYNVDSTPTTIFVTNGKEVSVMQRIEGNLSEEKVISKLKDNNYIK